MLSACQQMPKQNTTVPNKQNSIAAYNPHDYGRAYSYFLTKAKQGDPIAADNLGHMYEDGRGVVPNDQEAVKWFSQAAKAGNSDGQLNLGVLYLYGKGVAQDKIEACKWFAKAKAKHNTYAEEFHRKNC
jgi:TPR repeat protein